MKKTILNVALGAAVGLCVTSCKSPFYQVYEVGTDNLRQQDNSLVYENEDCKVLYNLWSNEGEIKFAIFNKTDKDIFVNLGQSFFVKNGLATDYYQGRTFTTQSFAQSSYLTEAASVIGTVSGFWGDNIYMENLNLQVGKAVSNSVTTKEAEIVCIPAKCYKVFNYYTVTPAWAYTCDEDKDFPKTTYSYGTYTKNTTPMSFKNRIA